MYEYILVYFSNIYVSFDTAISESDGTTSVSVSIQNAAVRLDCSHVSSA